jgi:hypothetical protein
MSTAEEMAEYIMLWEVVQEVQFSHEPDQISWKWTANGLYSSKSTYEIQFSRKLHLQHPGNLEG